MIWKPHATVAAIVERDNKFLMVEEVIDGERLINQPAGHVDEGESMTDAIRREVLEETGFEFTPTELTGIYYFVATNEISYCRFCFTGELGAQIYNDPPDPDITRTHWLTLNELKLRALRSPIVLDSLNDYLAGNRYPLELISDYIRR